MRKNKLNIKKTTIEKEEWSQFSSFLKEENFHDKFYAMSGHLMIRKIRGKVVLEELNNSVYTRVESTLPELVFSFTQVYKSWKASRK